MGLAKTSKRIVGGLRYSYVVGIFKWVPSYNKKDLPPCTSDSGRRGFDFAANHRPRHLPPTHHLFCRIFGTKIAGALSLSGLTQPAGHKFALVKSVIGVKCNLVGGNTSEYISLPRQAVLSLIQSSWSDSDIKEWYFWPQFGRRKSEECINTSGLRNLLTRQQVLPLLEKQRLCPSGTSHRLTRLKKKDKFKRPEHS